MADDIVNRLRCEQHYSKPNADPCICPVCSTLAAAVDEIERLRKLGDHLFMHAASHYGIGKPCPDWVKRDLDAWQEARRG